MVDFNKQIKFSDKFRQAALQFIATGHYCTYPQGSSEYFKFWDQEKDRCINGYTADDGDYITGYNYFYLNYCPIQRMVYTKDEKTGKVKKSREVSFPDFWDYDYYFFQALDDAEDQGKHMCVLKSRRKGFSYKMASACCRNYYLIPASKSYVYASNKQYLTEDGILTKAWDYMDFIDDNTAWGKKRSVNTQMRKRAGFFSRDEYGNEVELGYKSEIIGVTLKDNASACRGKAGRLIIFEEAGCHIRGTKVMLSDGSIKNVEDIKVGEYLMGPDGTPREVLETHTGTDHMYEITPINGDKQIVNSNHLIYGMHRQWYNNTYEPFTMKAKDYYEMLLKRPYLKAHYSLIKTQFDWPEKQHIIDPYFLGLWLGDGCSDSSTIANMDVEVIEYLQNYAETHGLYARIRKCNVTNKCFSIHLSSGKPGRRNWILDELRRLNVLNNKHIPEDYIYDSRENRLKLLAGLIDTDSWYEPKKQYLCMSQASQRKHIIYAAQYIARSLGIKCTVITKKVKTHKLRDRVIKGGNTEYRLILLNNHQDIPTKIARKQVKDYNRIQLDPLSTRFNIDYYGVDQYYGFTVDKDNLFVLGDFTIVHNSFDNLSAAWQIARPSVEQDGVAFGVLIAMGTGGDESSHFATLKDMFYHPEGYNCIGFPNIWDETATTNQCGFFVPQYTNLDFRDSDGNRIYMDNDGNTLRKKALDYILEERRKIVENATSNEAIDRWVAEHCITPSDACLEFNGNIFPKKELQEQLALLRTNTKLQNHKQVGDLVWQPDGSLKWVIKKTGDITHYPLRQGEDPTGSIVIWEHPNREASLGLYIAGCLTPGEKVLTDKGYKAVEDVTFDDKLISKDGNYVDIHNLQRYYKEDETIYKVRVSHNYSTTTFTSEHPLYVADELNTEYKFVRVKDIKAGQWIKYPNIYKHLYNLTAEQILNTRALTSESLDELEETQDMLLSVGIVSDIMKDTAYRLLIQKECDDCFFSDDLNYIYFKIREIEKSKYTGVVYNFECDTHTFLCRNITTHNCDSYDYDESTTTSLGSIFIYKRIQSIEEYSDIIVAEYTGRPKTAEEFYENVRKLLVYYNARCMYENQNKGLFAYLTNKHCDYLLADQPDIISDIIKDSKVQRKKGCHMNKQLKQWGWGLIKDWLIGINADGKKNLYNIMSEPLLEELIAANDIVNVDRVMALTQLMIYREELYNVKVKEIKKENRERVLFDGPIFTQEWFRDDGTDNIEAYMF